MVHSKTIFPVTPRLRLSDGSLDWPAIALRNTESAASVTHVHSQNIYSPEYQTQLQQHADDLWTHAEGAWDRFFKDLPAAARSRTEHAQMREHYLNHAARADILCTSGALTAPAKQRLGDHMERWRQRTSAAIVRPLRDT